MKSEANYNAQDAIDSAFDELAKADMRYGILYSTLFGWRLTMFNHIPKLEHLDLMCQAATALYGVAYVLDTTTKVKFTSEPT